MAHASSIKRLVPSDYPAELRRFVEAINQFIASTSLAIGDLPGVVVREFTVAIPDAWTALTIGGLWTTQYGPAGYSKAAGVVSLRGVIKGGTYGATALFTLPAPFRPPVTRYLPVTQSSAVYEGGGQIQVFPSGAVVAPAIVSVQTGASTYLSLDGVAFEASDLSAPTLATPIALTSTLDAVTGVVPLACFDVTTGTPVAAPPPAISWSSTSVGVNISSLAGLAGGRRYTLRVALLSF